MATVYKPPGRKKYIIEYVDSDGRRRRKTGSGDKEGTEWIARKIENEVALRKAGVYDKAAERFAASEAKSITLHLDEFVAWMRSKKRDAKHVRTTRAYIERILEQARVESLSDLTLSAVEVAISKIQESLDLSAKGFNNLSARGFNAHATAIKSFANWAKKDNHIRTHELGKIGRQNEQADQRYKRRPLTETELRKLIKTTRTAPVWRGISGADRAMFYLIGAATGYRRSELGSLQRADFDLAGKMPFIRLDASQTKNGKESEQPIPLKLAAELDEWLADKPTNQLVFPSLPEKTAKMLHLDLARCGIKPKDDHGRVVDTHSLRYAYVSALARSGATLKTMQTLARHSDPKLTMNIYAHVHAYDLHGTVENALPDLTAPEDDEIAPSARPRRKAK
jgi:integrase